MDTDRVAEITNPNWCYDENDERYLQSGTGYLIRKNLVLTASHILTFPKKDSPLQIEAKYDIRFIGDWKKGRKKWRESEAILCWYSKEFDIALLKLEGEGSSPSFLNETASMDIQFGSLNNDEDFSAEGAGFPKAQKVMGDKQDAKLVKGKLSKFDGIKTDTLLLEVTNLSPQNPDDWSGISGTAIFVEKHLVGVVITTDREGYGPKALRAVPISSLVSNEEFSQLVFDKKEHPPIQTLPIPSVPKTSSGDPIIDADEQDEYAPPISLKEFLEELKEYDSYDYSPENDPRKLSIFNKIASHVWYFIIEKSEADIRKKISEYRDVDNNLSKIIAPLRTIHDNPKEVTTVEILNFLNARKVCGDSRSDDFALQGYYKLLRRLIIYLLYHSPSILSNNSVSEHLIELTGKENLFWIEFFVDIYLRYKCGNLTIPNNVFIKTIKKVCDQYRQLYPDKPIVKLWKFITDPLEIHDQFNRESALNIIRINAIRSQHYIEVKWCIASAARILPLYNGDGDEENDCNFINSLFEESFNKEIVNKSPQLQSFYLRGLLKSFIHTKKLECLINYEKAFKGLYKISSDTSKSHLQLEYVCCVYIFCCFLSSDEYSEKFPQLQIGRLINSTNSDISKHFLLENYRINDKHKIYGNIEPDKRKTVQLFLLKYISEMYSNYAKGVIELNHLSLRELPALTRIQELSSVIAESTLLSLNRAINPDNLQESSFYAKSTAMLSHIPRQIHIELIRIYVTKALEANKYSILRSAKDIIWGLYSCNYYGDEQYRDEIQELATKFGLMTNIVDVQGEINDRIPAKVHWAYYAGIKVIQWNDRPAEWDFIKDLCAVRLSGKTYQLYNFERHNKVEFPDEMFSVIDEYSGESIFAATLKENFNIPELWNIIGTIIMDNKNVTDCSLSDELRKAARFYSIAKCFAVWGKDYTQKYCFNYIKAQSLFIEKIGFLEKNIFFIEDTARYLSYRYNRANLFYYKQECAINYLIILQKNWHKFGNDTHAELANLLAVHWLNKELIKPEFVTLHKLLRSVKGDR